MRKSTIHFNAFTIIEVVVALLVSALVIALAMTLYFISVSFYQQLQTQFDKEQQCDLLTLQLQRDIANCQIVYYSEETLILKTPIDSIVYKKIENGYLKNNDTILCSRREDLHNFILKETIVRPIKIYRNGN